MAKQPSATPESFEATVTYLKDKMHEKGTAISDSEIAQKLNIPVSTFLEYVENDSAPHEIVASLKREFKDVIGSHVIAKVDLDDDFLDADEA